MPIKYVPLYKDPIKGQAILDNFTRTKRVLKYGKNEEVYDHINRGMPYYELEENEIVGNDKDTKNLLVRGECISTCAYLKDKGIEVDLVYIDPPFASGMDYSKKVYIRKNPKLLDKIKKKEEKLKDEELQSFDEKMYGDIWNKEMYLNWMYDNLMAIKSIMSDNASIYVHLDHHICHYVKILLDEIFGEENFVNEIIWSYRSGGASKSEALPQKHDVIFLYKNGDENVINNKIERQYLDKPFMDTKIDKDGKYYVDTILRDVFEGAPYIMNENKLEQYNMRPVLNLSKERLDYDTQKPEGLLKILIEIASNEGMVVADFFGGSGVTAKVANDLKRNFISCDVGINSIQTTRDRLVSENANFKIMDIKDGVNLYRNPIQTMDKLKHLINGLNDDNTLDSFWMGSIKDSKKGKIPVYVPNLIDSSTRVLDLHIIDEIMKIYMQNLDNVEKVIVYYIDIEDEEKIKKYIKDNNNTGIEIELRDLKVILSQTIIDDKVDYLSFDNKEDSRKKYGIEIKRFISDRLSNKISEYNQKGFLNQEKKKDTDNKKEFKPIIISEEGLELIEYISLDCTNKQGKWQSDEEIKISKEGYVITNGKKTKTFWNGKITSSKKPLRMKVRNIAGDEVVLQIEN
ncbi:MAG: site-specific DNA-methyltransferase [Bacteroidales bacterium]|jgi:adenine-specific DNA-methyltransferase|nr:site-specific DNA-methyltransferase [Bacteroidales bacterium]